MACALTFGENFDDMLQKMLVKFCEAREIPRRRWSEVKKACYEYRRNCLTNAWIEDAVKYFLEHIWGGDSSEEEASEQEIRSTVTSDSEARAWSSSEEEEDWRADEDARASWSSPSWRSSWSSWRHSEGPERWCPEQSEEEEEEEVFAVGGGVV